MVLGPEFADHRTTLVVYLGAGNAGRAKTVCTSEPKILGAQNVVYLGTENPGRTERGVPRSRKSLRSWPAQARPWTQLGLWAQAGPQPEPVLGPSRASDPSALVQAGLGHYLATSAVYFLGSSKVFECFWVPL